MVKRLADTAALDRLSSISLTAKKLNRNLLLRIYG